MWVYACVLIDSLSIGTCDLVGKLLRTSNIGFSHGRSHLVYDVYLSALFAFFLLIDLIFYARVLRGQVQLHISELQNYTTAELQNCSVLYVDRCIHKRPVQTSN